jgi:hypothetical protein
MIKRVVQLAQVTQPFCVRTYALAPCAAVLGTTGDRKCFNSRKTCQDPAHYQPATRSFLLASPQDGVDTAYGAIPAIVPPVSTVPGEINLGGVDGDRSPLGRREVVTIALKNFRHADLGFDKYRLERAPGAATNYLFLPGTPGNTFPGNNATTQASAALGLATDLDVRALVQAVAYAPGAVQQVLLSKASGAAGVAALSYRFLLTSDGRLQLAWSNGAATQTVQSSVLAVAAGAKIYLRSTLDADGGAAGVYQVKFYTSPDGVVWTTINTIDGAAPAAIRVGSDPLWIGTQSELGASNFAGFIFLVELRSSINGALVARFAPGDAPGDVDSFKSKVTGEVWTINRATPAAVLSTCGYEAGTFLGKFLARNPYYAGYSLVVYEGELGQPVVQNLVRQSQDWTGFAWSVSAGLITGGGADTWWLLTDATAVARRW